MFEYNNKPLFYIYRKLLTFCDKMNGRQSKVGCLPFYMLGIILKIIFVRETGLEELIPEKAQKVPEFLF